MKKTNPRAIIGTWWLKLADAKKDAKKKTLCKHFPFIIIREPKGYWVVSKGQLK